MESVGGGWRVDSQYEEEEFVGLEDGCAYIRCSH